MPEEEVVLGALADLEKARALVAEEGGLVEPDFVTRVRGRTRPTETEAAGSHALQAMARTDLGRSFCERRGLPSTFKCTLLTHGERHAGMFCRAWCHCMQHFFDAELTSVECEALVFTREVVDAYQEPTELRELAGRKLKKLSDDALCKVRALPFLR